jgi:hypothetical protein
MSSMVMLTMPQPSTCRHSWWWGHGAPWGLVIGLKKKLAKNKERGNIPAVYLQDSELVHGTDARGSRMLCDLAKKKTEPGTNKAQLNLTQHG